MKKTKGHAEHMKDATGPKALNGEIIRPINLVFLGAGSAFAPKLLNDVMLIDGNKGGELRLCDLDAKRLKLMETYVKHIIAKNGYKNWKVKSSTNRKTLLKGANYIVNCIEVSGTQCVKHDYEIPLSYGIDQCIGDTIGPGGLFKALRTVPEWLKILKDIETDCPDALVLNYTNPMSIMCLASGRSSPVQVVGLCHSVQGSSQQLAKRTPYDIKDIEWECAGINHLAWFTKFAYKGKDLYPDLIKRALKDIAGKPVNKDDRYDIVRKDMMVHFGAYITESSGHLSEYLPYYRKRKDLLKKYMGPDYNGGSGFYSKNWPNWRKDRDKKLSSCVKGNSDDITKNRTWEYASWIIEAKEKDSPFRIHGNVMNKTKNGGPAISNLSHDGCVEVSCMVDRNGVNPTIFGQLPSHMAGICQINMNMYDLAAKSAMEKSVEAAIHSLYLDPLSAAVCCPAEIKEMTLKMFKAEKAFLKGFK